MIRIDASNWTADFRIARALAEGYEASGLDEVVFFCVGDPQDLVGRLGPLVADETIKYYPNVLGTTEDPITAANFDAKVTELYERFPDVYVIGIEAGYGLLSHLGSIEITDRSFSTLRTDDYVTDVTVNVVLRVREPGTPRAQSAREQVSDDAGQDGAAAGRADQPGHGREHQYAQGRGEEREGGINRRLARARRASGLAEAALEVGSDEAAYGRKAFKPLRPDQIDAFRVQQMADKVIDGNLRFLSRIKKQQL